MFFANKFAPTPGSRIIVHSHFKLTLVNIALCSSFIVCGVECLTIDFLIVVKVALP